MPVGPAAGGGDRRGSAERGERSLGPHAFRVASGGDQQLGGGVGADSVGGPQAGIVDGGLTVQGFGQGRVLGGHVERAEKLYRQVPPNRAAPRTRGADCIAIRTMGASSGRSPGARGSAEARPRDGARLPVRPARPGISRSRTVSGSATSHPTGAPGGQPFAFLLYLPVEMSVPRARETTHERPSYLLVSLVRPARPGINPRPRPLTRSRGAAVADVSPHARESPPSQRNPKMLNHVRPGRRGIAPRAPARWACRWSPSRAPGE